MELIPCEPQAGQWFALPQLFPASKNEGYEIIKNEPNLIQ